MHKVEKIYNKQFFGQYQDLGDGAAIVNLNGKRWYVETIDGNYEANVIGTVGCGIGKTVTEAVHNFLDQR